MVKAIERKFACRILLGMAELGSPSTSAWLSQKINPYFPFLMRGREVLLEMDVHIVRHTPSEAWERWYEMCAAPRCAPLVFLSEVRDFNIQKLILMRNHETQ